MRKNRWIQEYGLIVLTGVVVGLAALILTAAGNPKNMGFCIACFLRDIAGALGMHSSANVQYIRPEIIGIVLGAAIAAAATREFRAKAGSSPACRFVLGLFVMIGALVFLGCPLRMVIRLGGGDLPAHGLCLFCQTLSDIRHWSAPSLCCRSCAASQISSTEMSAGLTPLMRPAWPMFSGFTLFSFSTASSRRPLIWA